MSDDEFRAVQEVRRRGARRRRRQGDPEAPSSPTTSTPTASTWSSWSWRSRRSSTSPSTRTSSRASTTVGSRPRPGQLQALMAEPADRRPSPGRRHRPRRRRRVRHRRRRVLGGPARPAARGHCAAIARLRPDALLRQPQGVAARRPLRAVRLAAAAEALEQAGDPTGDPLRRGVIVGTGVGGLSTLEDQIVVRPREGPAAGVAVPRPDDDGERAGAPPSRCGTAGRARARTTVTACAAGTHSIGNAARLIAVGPLRRRHRRQHRGRHDADRHRRLHQHDRAVEPPASRGPSTPTATAS